MNVAVQDDTSHFRRAYRQLFQLGAGGMARVYLAETLASGVRKLVVLKVLNADLAADPEMRAAFSREAELAAQMNHPNVVQVTEVVEYASLPIIVMEYLDGTPLSALLREAAADLPLPLHLLILAQALSGLHHFHELKDLEGTPLGAVHRDVSPQNIMVLHDGLVKVLDFGIAKVLGRDDQATRTGVIKGKIQYMPPEQLLGEVGIDRRADIFAVGVMLWEAIARRRMWEGKNELDLLRSLAGGDIPRIEDVVPDVPSRLAAIVNKATGVERERRFPTAQAMQTAIERELAQQGWLTGPSDLADFMTRRFGELRRSRDERIKAALRSHDNVAVLNAHTSISTLPPELVLLGESRIAQSGTEQVSRVLRVNGRHWGWGLALAASAALVAAWATARGQQANGPVAAVSTAIPASVTFEVDVLPAGAEILLDGQLLGRDHYAGDVPTSDRKVWLEVRAPGHLSERKELSLRKDMTLQIVLKPEVPPSTPESSVQLMEALPAKTELGSVATKSRVRTSTPKLAALPALKDVAGCKPPYTFAADGVKVYKPECFGRR